MREQRIEAATVWTGVQREWGVQESQSPTGSSTLRTWWLLARAIGVPGTTLKPQKCYLLEALKGAHLSGVHSF